MMVVALMPFMMVAMAAFFPVMMVMLMATFFPVMMVVLMAAFLPAMMMVLMAAFFPAMMVVLMAAFFPVMMMVLMASACTIRAMVMVMMLFLLMFSAHFFHQLRFQILRAFDCFQDGLPVQFFPRRRYNCCLRIMFPYHIHTGGQLFRTDFSCPA